MLGKNPEHGIARATSKIMNSIKIATFLGHKVVNFRGKC